MTLNFETNFVFSFSGVVAALLFRRSSIFLLSILLFFSVMLRSLVQGGLTSRKKNVTMWVTGIKLLIVHAHATSLCVCNSLRSMSPCRVIFKPFYLKILIKK